MYGSIKEVIGFLSRWTLLALASGILLGGAWSGMLAASGVAADIRARVILPDAASDPPEGQPVRWIGHLDTLRYHKMPLFLCHADYQRKPTVAIALKEKLVVVVSDPRMGPQRVHLRGIPYGPMAFRRHNPTVLIVPEDERILLVDARLAHRAVTEGAEGFRESLAAMRRTGQYVLVDFGDAEEFASRAGTLRRMFPDTALLWPVPVRPALAAKLAFVGHCFGRRDRANLFLVTSDAETALSAARANVRVHYISGSGGPVEPHPLIHRHDGFDALRQGLLSDLPKE